MQAITFFDAAYAGCWGGQFTYQRCCMHADLDCFDGVDFTAERCCHIGNHSYTWWSDAHEAITLDHFVLWYVSTRPGCFASPHHSREMCCNQGHLTSTLCFNRIFTHDKCCGEPPPGDQQPARGDPSCWAEGYSYELCCRGSRQGGCWDEHGLYSFERCCGAQAAPPVPSLPRNLSALERLAHGRECARLGDAPRCGELWHLGLQSTGPYTDGRLQQVAIGLARRWARRRRLEGLVHASPAFVLSVMLYAAVALIDEWAGHESESSANWAEVQDQLAFFREHFASITAAEVSKFYIGALDAALRDRLHLHYTTALQGALFERMTIAQEPPLGALFEIRWNDSMLAALREVAVAFTNAKVEFMPIQGTLIALLRYGSFPVGRLSHGKVDVVDNDAEIMIILKREEDVLKIGSALSLALEAFGWPPCIHPRQRQFICFSLRHAIPLKLELYFMVKDAAEGLVYASRRCSAPGLCEYNSEFPLQHWDGRVPWDVVFPLGRCRVGGVGWHVPCPNKPVDLIRGWNAGEYQKQSLVPMTSAMPGHADSVPAARPTAESSTLSACFALPVMSRDRDAGDARNIKLQVKGLAARDLAMIAGYARALHKQGFASFHAHLQETPCRKRRKRIVSGNDSHAGLGWLRNWENDAHRSLK